MYLARFEADAGEWLQGVAAIPVTPPPDARPGWWSELESVVRDATLIDGMSVSRRVSLGGDGLLRQLVMVLARSEHEPEIRRLLARLTRLEAAVSGSVALPGARDEHDAWVADVPDLRWSTTAESFAAGGIPLGLDFRVGPSLDRLIVAAEAHGALFAYQVNLRALRPEPEESRAARRGVLALSGQPGARPDLVEWQERMARGLLSANVLVEEFVAIDSEAGAATLSRLIGDAYRARLGAIAPIRPEVRFVAGGFDEGLHLGLHTHDLHALHGLELGGVAAGPGERDALVRWRPASLPSTVFGGGALAGLDDQPTGSAPAGLPPPIAGEGPYLFVSYKREDLPRIAPTLQRLAGSGVRLWYDRGIPGGTEWDAVIEEHLTGCELVLLFASGAAVRSKYVRREVKFADAIDTPIICVMLEEADLVQGMRMLLTQYQMLDARAGDFDDRLMASIRHTLARSPTPALPR
jgi:hypothetical protein